MRLIDLISLILENLGRRKGRVALTAVGVVIGTAAVVVLVSLATGLQKNATSQLGGIGDLTQIQVMPNYEEIKGPMVVQGGSGNSPQQPKMKLITHETITDIGKIPGVKSVIPRDYMQANAMMSYGKLEGYGNI